MVSKPRYEQEEYWKKKDEAKRKTWKRERRRMVAQPHCTHTTDVWRGHYKMWYKRRHNFENYVHRNTERKQSIEIIPEKCTGPISSDALHWQVAPLQPQLAPVANSAVASAAQRVKRHLVTRVSRVCLKRGTPVLQNCLNYNLYTYH